MAKKMRKIHIYSALEVANLCGVVNQTAINWIKSGYLKAFTTPGGQYRVYADELASFLQSQHMRLPQELKKFVQERVNIKEKTLLLGLAEQAENQLSRHLSESLPSYHTIQVRNSFDLGCYLYKFNPQVVVLDWDAFGNESKEICKKIKGDNNLSTPLIIALITNNANFTEETAQQNGIDVFLHKPYDAQELINLIRNKEASQEER